MSEQDQREARKRLVDLIDSSQSLSALARKAGMTKGHISGLKNGKSFGANAQANLEQALGLRPGYFSGRDSPSDEADSLVHWLPVKDIEDADKPARHGARKLPIVTAASREAFLVLMQSDAMMAGSPGERSIPPGVYVVVDPIAKHDSGDDVLVVMKPGAAPCIRRVVRDGEWVYLRAINPDYHELTKMRPETRVLGRVMGIHSAF